MRDTVFWDSFVHNQQENFFLWLPKCSQFVLEQIEGISRTACPLGQQPVKEYNNEQNLINHDIFIM